MNSSSSVLTAARSLLTAGALALLSTAGCGPGADDATTAPSSIDTSPAAPEPGDIISRPAPGALDSILFGPGDRVARGALATTQRFDHDAFATAVKRVATELDVGVAALPSVEARAVDEVEDSVRSVVARATFVKPEGLSAERLSCGEDSLKSCADRFVFRVAARNEPLAEALAPLARQVFTLGRDVRVEVWSRTRRGVTDDVAVTLHGHWGGRLVGVVSFR